MDEHDKRLQTSLALAANQLAEVDWYRKHGKYPAKRIATDSNGAPYVIGDASWNRKAGNPPEVIEDRMAVALRAASTAAARARGV